MFPQKHKMPTHQQNQTVAGRVGLNGDCRMWNMLQNYSFSLMKFFSSAPLSLAAGETVDCSAVLKSVKNNRAAVFVCATGETSV